MVVVRVEVIIAPVRVPLDWLHHDHHHVITLVGITEIGDLKSGADLKTSYTIIWSKLQTNFEVLDSKLPSGSRKSSTAQQEKRFLTGRQVAWMINEYLKVSDTDESVLDLKEKFECRIEDRQTCSRSTRDKTKSSSRWRNSQMTIIWKMCFIVSLNCQNR